MEEHGTKPKSKATCESDVSSDMQALYPLKIEELFSNVERVKDDRFQAFRVRDRHGSDTGTMTYLGKNEWRFYLDNFPGEKKYFSSNLPIGSIQQFIDDVSRTGLVLTKV